MTGVHFTLLCRIQPTQASSCPVHSLAQELKKLRKEASVLMHSTHMSCRRHWLGRARRRCRW